MILHQHTSLNFGIGHDVGRKREGKPNEDNFGSYADLSLTKSDMAQKGLLYIVADGMGGAAAGATASKMAVEHTLAYYYQDVGTKPVYCLDRAIQNANAQIYQLGHSDLSYHGMGTTIVAAIFHADMLHLGHVGDSRAYLLRDGELLQLTKDHSLVQAQVRAELLTPEEAATHPQRNVLTRNLGGETQAQPDFVSHRVYPGDVVLLCSDGLWGEVSDEEIAMVLHQYNAATAAQKLVDLANEHGGSDNICLMIRQVDWSTESAAEILPPRKEEEIDTIPLPNVAAPNARQPQTQAVAQNGWAIAATEAQMPLVGLLAAAFFLSFIMMMAFSNGFL